MDVTAGVPDPVWILLFMTIAHDIFSPPMHNLWSRILRQVVLAPGSISLLC
ncbi:DUF2806 domain-containing protein, partial [Photobacterium sp. R1]